MARDMTQTSPEHAEEDDTATRDGDGSLSGPTSGGKAGGGNRDKVSDSKVLRLTDNGGSVSGAPSLSGIEDITTVVAEHESALLRYARHQLGRDYEGGHHDSQDIVQEALLRLHRHWRQDGIEGVKNVRAWLMRVTHNLVIDAIRKRGRQREGKLRLQQDAVGTEGEMNGQTNSLDSLETREATDEAMRLLHELPNTQQRVLMLRLNDLTVREIAKVLNMSPGNVGYHMNQALMTLARQLKQAGAV